MQVGWDNCCTTIISTKQITALPFVLFLSSSIVWQMLGHDEDDNSFYCACTLVWLVADVRSIQRTKGCVFTIVRFPFPQCYQSDHHTGHGWSGSAFSIFPYRSAVNPIMKVGSRRPFLVSHLETQRSVHDPKILVHSLGDATTHLPLLLSRTASDTSNLSHLFFIFE
ncbi:hypothetical protein BDR22DRAFT_55407 [Usnea florida]